MTRAQTCMVLARARLRVTEMLGLEKRDACQEEPRPRRQMHRESGPLKEIVPKRMKAGFALTPKESDLLPLPPNR